MGRDLIDLFVALSLGVLNETLFLGSKAAPKTGTVLIVTATPGLRPVFVQDKSAPSMRRPSAQVVVKSQSLAAAEALAERAYQATLQTNAWIGGRFYQRITPSQEPFDMGTDDDGRMKLGFNVLGSFS